MKIKVIKSIKFNGIKQVPELNLDEINRSIMYRVCCCNWMNENAFNTVNNNAINNELTSRIHQLKVKLIDGVDPFNIWINTKAEVFNEYKVHLDIIIQKVFYKMSGMELDKRDTNASIDIELTDKDVDIQFVHKDIESRNILFRYCNGKLIAYEYDNYVYESESGFDETKVINNFTQKFQAKDLGDKIKKEYLEALSELNKKLLEKYGVTLECRRTNSLSIVKDGKSIKSIVVKQ